MSIKDLFDKGQSLKFVKNKTKDDLSENVESYRYIEAYSEKRARFVPDVDFATASNFARFGSAEEYYDAAIKRIYQTYPYDGSQAEKIEWENISTYLDLFIFENEYPRTNGFVTFNSSSHTYTSTNDSGYYSSSLPQYILFNGGPNADPNEDYKSDFSAGPSQKGVSKANIYHTASQRTNNLEFDPSKGVTIEFWMKKDGWASTDAANPKYEVPFNLIASGATGDNYSNFFLRFAGHDSTNKSNILFKVVSGSSQFAAHVGTGLDDIADGNWHHYAFTFKTYSGKNKLSFYFDGVHRTTKDFTGFISGPLATPSVAALGALAGDLLEVNPGKAGPGWANVVSCSFDEFRYWKTERSAQQIGRFYRDQVGGGTNTDNIKYDDVTNKVDLGVYYKFNEGITGETETDKTILDYSGRISNGELINYSSECRDTESAIVQAGAAAKEFKDPVLYSFHPDVSSLLAQKQVSGSAHDHENVVSLYKSLPGWIAEEDEKESNNLKYLTQILASYFDDLYLQIEKLPRLKDINFPDDNSYEKPLPFAEHLLSSRGYEAPELFADVSDLAKYLERDERILFEKKLYEIKNIIYQNIYNNLSYIQKSKGTFKSLRNFLRCFGVDEELIKLNIYSNNDVYEFKNNETHTAVRKKYIDFDDLETRFTASGEYGSSYTANAYQYYDSTDSNSLSYIPAATETLLTGACMTIETEVIFPKRQIIGDKNYQMFPSVTSSIFGLHAVEASNTDLSFASDDTINFSVVAVKPDNDLRNVKFALETSGSSVFTELKNSNSFASVYNNEKWNLAFRLRPTKLNPNDPSVKSDSIGYLEPAASAYTYELYGVNYLSNILRDEFTLTGTISRAQAESFFTKPKRVFIGAMKNNFTGNIVKYSDVKVSSTRVWLDYLPDEIIRSHAKDATSYGALSPYKNSNDSLNAKYVPQISTLVLNWAMHDVTGSDSSGQFLIKDFSSGSTDVRLKFGNDWSRNISKYNYSGRGDGFSTNLNFLDQAIDLEYVQSAKLKLPEIVNSDDMVKILNKQDDVLFTRDTTFIQHLLSVEKSMYQTISEEMLRMFASISDFNNLIGEPVNRYRQDYKKLKKLRELFFENVENDRLDLEKFIEYFKWIDDAITMMIAQLIPVSSNAVDMLRNMVESHVFERNKYCNKFPTLESKIPEPISSLKAIEELKYNWKFGHAPVSPDQNTNQDENCLWWKQRAERDSVLTSDNDNVDSDKSTLLGIAITEVSGTGPTLKTIAGARYTRSHYYNRSLARPIDLVTKRSVKLKGGGNKEVSNLHDYYKSVVKWGSDNDFIYLDVDNEIKSVDCSDQVVPPEIDKKYFNFKALTMHSRETIESDASGSGLDDKKYEDTKSTLLLPFSVYTSSITSGYRGRFSQDVKLDFTNLHEDKYGYDLEIPMQGVFTEKHVGGMQHRHVSFNRYNENKNSSTTNKLDSELTRPEGWFLEQLLTIADTEYIINEAFDKATAEVTENSSILIDDPNDLDNWRNAVNTANPWSFISGESDTTGTGPGGGQAGKYAYCDINGGLRAGQTFGLVTPLIDLLDLNSNTVTLAFKYHMHGLNMGILKVQASTDPDFATGVEDIEMTWNVGGTNTVATHIAGQQHTNATDAFHQASVSTGGGLSNFINKRFYIRFLYTAGITHLGEVALDEITVYKLPQSGAYDQNSFKLLSPTHDNHNRPSAVYTRDTIAKRSINIRNIQTTGNLPTEAGNYLDRYEYVNTTSPEANDPWFVKNSDKIKRTTSEILGLNKESVATITFVSDDFNDYVDKQLVVPRSIQQSTDILSIYIAGASGPSTGTVTSLGVTAKISGKTTAASIASEIKTAIESANADAVPPLDISINGATLTFRAIRPNKIKFNFIDSDANVRNPQHDLNIINIEDFTITAGGILSALSGSSAINYALPNRDYLSGSVKNRTRIKTRFSSPGGFEVMSRGYLDPAHEIYSVYNVMTFRNLRARRVHNSQLQAHQGPFGVSTHGPTTTSARVYGDEVVGSIRKEDYQVAGDAAVHKYHRNNIERLEMSIGSEDIDGATVVTASAFDNAFVSHMIPRTDNQTRWITASLI